MNLGFDISSSGYFVATPASIGLADADVRVMLDITGESDASAAVARLLDAGACKIPALVALHNAAIRLNAALDCGRC